MSDAITERTEQQAFTALASRERRRLVMWLVLSVFAALLAYFGFRGYLNPELLFHFANSFVC